MVEYNISWSEFEEQRGGGFVNPDPGEQEFEIVGIKQGCDKSGNNVGAPHINVRVAQISGENPHTKTTFKFLGLGTKPSARGTIPLGETKAFLIDIGRSDLMEGGPFNPDELMGTTFIADVSIAKRKGGAPGEVNVYLNNPRALSHANYDGDDIHSVEDADSVPEPEPVPPPRAVAAPKPQPAQATNRRAVAARR
jgi:hypothetical protein